MPDHTFTDLLAGVIDLAPSGTPPHRPGPVHRAVRSRLCGRAGRRERGRTGPGCIRRTGPGDVDLRRRSRHAVGPATPARRSERHEPRPHRWATQAQGSRCPDRGRADGGRLLTRVRHPERTGVRHGRTGDDCDSAVDRGHHHRCHGSGRVHRRHGAPAQRVDLSVPRFRREVPRRLRPGADQRRPDPGHRRSGRRRRRRRPRHGPRLLLGHRPRPAGLPVRRLQPAAAAAVEPGDRHRVRGPGVARAARRLHRRLPAERPEGRRPPPLRHGRGQPRVPGPRRLRLPRRAVRHRAPEPRG